MDLTRRVFCTIVITALLTSSTNAQFGFLGSIFSSDEEIAVPVTTPAPVENNVDGCVCKPFNQCSTYESDEDGVNQIDIRNNFGPCPSYLDVCCNETSSTGHGEKNNGNSGYNTNSNNNFNTNSGGYGQGENSYNNNNNDNNNNNNNNNQQTSGGYGGTSSPHTEESNRDTQTCGVWNKNGVGFRVTNAINSESQYAEYPSMVAIFREENPLFGERKLFYHCGGSLIKPNVVLTAAHCVIGKEPSSIVLRAGEWDLQTEKEIYMHQDRHARKIVTHPKYYAGGLHNDIALIFTDDAFLLQETVRTICLPKRNQNFDRAYCYSSGWGKEVFVNNYTISHTTDAGTTNTIGHYYVNILKKVELPIVEKYACEDALRSTRLGPKFRLHESFICAGGEEGKDTCKGDGGSPLMCPSEEDSNHLVQAGIVAWGVGCGVHKIPAAYVNVAHFRDWIDDEISANSYMTTADKEMPVPSPTSESKVNNEQGCVCKPFNQCPTYESDADGLNQIDIRNNFGPCPSYLDVCCNETSTGQHEKNTDITGSNSFNSNSNGSQGSNNNYGNGKYNNSSNQFSTDQTASSTEIHQITTGNQERCGIWNRKGLGFKVVNAINGESQYAEFPSMIAIFREEITSFGEKNLFYNCGGSLIAPRVVLTAAHCVIKREPSTVVARAGDWDLQTEKEMYLHQNRYARKIVIHESYYAAGLHNDIALIFLDEPFTLQDTVKIMCLPKQNQIFDHSFCFSSGWGKDVSVNNYTVTRKTKEGTINEIGQYQVSILKKVELPIVPNGICEEALRKTRLGSKFKLHKSFICAGGEEGTDTCKGDGGSPLMCPSEEDPNYLVQAGMVSWGISCGVHKVPAAYVNVAHFRDWIDSEIKINS